MVNLTELKKQRERDRDEDLKAIDTYVEWVRKTPNRIWSRQQADFFKSVYKAINENWRQGQKQK